MKHSTKLLVLVATAVSTVAFAGAGWAYWTASGTGAGTATVGTWDSTRPVLSALSVPTWINIATNTAVPVSGQISEANSSTVTIVATDHNGLTVTKLVAVTGGATTWGTTVNASTLADGTISYSVTAQDASGNTSTPALTGTSTKDTTRPANPTSVALTNGGGTANAFINLANRAAVNYSVVNGGNASGDTITVTLTSSGGGTAISSTAIRGATSPTAVNGINASGLGDGTVTSTAKATDPAGNDSASTATTTNTKDIVAPAAGVSSTTNPVNNANKAITTASGINEAGATVSVVASDGTTSSTAVAATVTGATWSASGINVTGLSDGTITYTATASDSAGNTATATRTATKDSVAPPAPSVSTSKPANKSVTVTFSDTEAGVTFECQVDTGAFSACTSPTTYGPDNAYNGSHTYSVRAIDTAGNVSAVTTKTQVA